MKGRTYVVALTGGIATGKSAVTQRFASHGVPVFDADVVARELVAVGQPALSEIAHVFGVRVIMSDGELDRARVREIVFADIGARHRLEAILHPRVRASLLDQVRTCAAPYCLLAIPLLVECRADYTWVDRVLTTDAPKEAQMTRLKHRPGISADMAQRILEAQVSREERLALANDVIDNTGPIQTLDSVIARLHKRYLKLAIS
jgi:dephospho-CoA kinase